MTNPPPQPIKLPLARAEAIANKIKAELQKFCLAIEIAGSIRRRRSLVGDIDIVALCKDEAHENLARKRIMRSNPHVLENGRQTLMVVLDIKGEPVQLDVWFAAAPTVELFGPVPGSWGTLLLCRTGPMQHNIKLASAARAKGWHWNPHSGLFDQDNHWIAGETEDSIYEALGLSPMTPEARDNY